MCVRSADLISTVVTEVNVYGAATKGGFVDEVAKVVREFDKEGRWLNCHGDIGESPRSWVDKLRHILLRSQIFVTFASAMALSSLDGPSLETLHRFNSEGRFRLPQRPTFCCHLAWAKSRLNADFSYIQILASNRLAIATLTYIMVIPVQGKLMRVDHLILSTRRWLLSKHVPQGGPC